MSKFRVMTGAVLSMMLGQGLSGESSPELSDELMPPVRLEADGKPIDHGDVWGHAGPCVFDVDGDGKRDLVVGDFSGTFTLYRNVGTDGAPRYESAGKLMAGDEPAKVWIYCCIGSSPQFADLNGDGKADLISGSYDPGMCYWFPSKGDGTFEGRGDAKLTELVDDVTMLMEDGETRTESDTNGLPLADAAGRPILRVPDQKQVWESFGSWPYPIDWDADGDLDLVIGGFDGTIQLRENVGEAGDFSFSENAIAIEAGGKQIGGSLLDVKHGDMHAAVVAADWDGDGLFDLVSGFDDGSVRWFRNVGKEGRPEFAAEQVLIPSREEAGYDSFVEPGETPKPGIRTQVAVADMNGDGKMDLVVGDFSQTYTPSELARQNLSDYRAARDEYLTAVAAYMKQNIALSGEKYKDFIKQFPEEERLSDEVSDKWKERYQELQAEPEYAETKEAYEAAKKKLEPYLERPAKSGSLDDYAASHGFVWLYVRR